VTKVVVDANVYISALVFGGVPRKVLDVIQNGGHELYIAQSIIDEVKGTLIEKFKWTDLGIEDFLPPLWRRCIVVAPTIKLAVCLDPEDDHVLACADEVSADFLITGNTKHFPKVHRVTKIVNPRHFLDLFG